jgi:dCMP deaminase
MVHKRSLDVAYLDMAERWSQLSRAERKQVGALIVKDGQIISDGFNGTPTGFDNFCEDVDGKTLPEVLHAESNALMKLARGNQSSDGATLYITLSPCFDCAKLIVQAGIKRVVFKERYDCAKGIHFLQRCRVAVEGPS